ncbi:MAG: hypothetical protein JNJ80_06775 [Gemmatimonadetes bacterium]|nr:hypothetical protein [Gemmatimonadota bacterium]MCC7131977.1 hypothetical protein [Gemmatimonadales bacterium]
MAWRVIEVGGEVWNISIAAERRANSDQWELVLSFRSAGPNPRRFWAPVPMQSTSKATIYSQAEKLSDRELVELLNEHNARR